MLNSFRSRLRAVADLSLRGLPPKGGGKKPGSATDAPAASGKMTVDKAPVNIYKAGQDPALGPDDAYPSWLWTLLDPQPTLEELKAKPSLTLRELRRVVRLERRRIIKETNEKSKL